MTDSLPPNDPLKAAWLSQPVETTRMTALDIETAATGLERKVRLRNRTEYVAGAVVAPIFGAGMLFGHHGWMMRTGFALSVLGILFILWQLHRRAGARQAPTGGSAQSLLAFQRAELTRQRDALRSVPLWYLLPLVPGFVMLMLGRWFQDHTPGRSLHDDHAMVVIGALIAGLIFVVVWLMNALGAARLDRRIDQLERTIAG